MKGKTWTGRNILGFCRSWKQHRTFLLRFPITSGYCSLGDHRDGRSSQCELTLSYQGRGGPRYALVPKLPFGSDTSTAHVYWPKQITSDFRVVRGAGKYISTVCLQGELGRLWTALVATWLSSEELESEQNTGEFCSACIITVRRRNR